MGVILFELALTFYFAATIISITELFKGTKITSKIMFSLAGIGFAIHSVNIVFRYVTAGHIPITNAHEAIFSFILLG